MPTQYKSQTKEFKAEQKRNLKAHKAKMQAQREQKAKENKRHASGVSVAEWEARTKPRPMVSTPGVVDQQYTVGRSGAVLNEKGQQVSKTERDRLGRTVGWREEVDPLTGARNMVPAMEKAQINRDPSQVGGHRLLPTDTAVGEPLRPAEAIPAAEQAPTRMAPTVATPDNAVITRGELPTLPGQETSLEKQLEDIAIKKAKGEPLTEDELRAEFQAARQQPSGPQMPQISPDPYMPAEFANLTAEQISMLSPADQARYQQYANFASLQRERDFQKQMEGQIEGVYDERMGEAQAEAEQAEQQITEENDALLNEFKDLRETMDADDIKAIKEAGAEGMTQIQNMMARRGFGRSSATAEQLQKATANTQARVAEIEAATGMAVSEYQVQLLDRLDQKMAKYEARVDKYKDAKDVAKLEAAQKDLDLAQQIFSADPKNPAKVFELAQTLSQQRIADKEALQASAVSKFEKALELGYVPTGMSEEELMVLSDNLGIAPEDFAQTVVGLVNRAQTKAQMEKVHYAQDIFGNTTAVIPNFDTGKFDSVTVASGPFGALGFTGGAAGMSSAGPGVYSGYGAVPDQTLTDIFGCGEVGDWCGVYSSTISDAGPVGNSWAEKSNAINKRLDPNDPSTYPSGGDKLLIPIGVKTDTGSGAGEYGHVATVIDFDPSTGNIKVIESNADGRQNRGEGKGIKTLGTYNINELDQMYSNAGGWGLRQGNFIPEIQQKLDAAYSTATPMMQPDQAPGGRVDFATAYNEAITRGAKDPMQTAAIWMATGMIPEVIRTPEEIAREEARAKVRNYQTAKFTQLNTTIDDVLNNVSNYTAGMGGAALASIPGTDAYNLSRQIETIKAQLSFQELEAMRAASPTGGALGSISERELTYLGSVLGSLDIGQSPDQLKKNLQGIKKSLATLNEVFAEAGGSTNNAMSAGGGGVDVIGTDGNTYHYDDPNDPEIAEGRAAGFFK